VFVTRVAHLERRIKELERKIQGEKRRELDIHSNWKQVLEKTLQLQNEFAHSSDVHKRTTEELRYLENDMLCCNPSGLGRVVWLQGTDSPCKTGVWVDPHQK
jgi:hypothetical protein